MELLAFSLASIVLFLSCCHKTIALKLRLVIISVSVITFVSPNERWPVYPTDCKPFVCPSRLFNLPSLRDPIVYSTVRHSPSSDRSSKKKMKKLSKN